MALRSGRRAPDPMPDFDFRQPTPQFWRRGEPECCSMVHPLDAKYRLGTRPCSSDTPGMNRKPMHVALKSLAFAFALVCGHAAAEVLSDVSMLEAAAERGEVSA